MIRKHSTNRVSAADIDMESLMSHNKIGTTLSEDPEYKDMGMFGLTANTMNAVIGAGILVLPSTVGSVGLANGIILLFCGAFLNWWGIHLLGIVSNELQREDQPNTFVSFGVVAEMVHKWLPFISTLLTFSNCAIMCVAYLTTFSNFMVDFVDTIINLSGVHVDNISEKWYSDHRVYVGFAALIVLPLSLPKKVTVLQHTSAAAIAFVFYTVILVVVYSGKPPDLLCQKFLVHNNATSCTNDKCCIPAESGNCCFGDISIFKPESPLAFIETIPKMITAFCCASQFFALYNAFRSPTSKRLGVGTGSALFLCLSLYVMISAAGYLTYGSTIGGDLLSTYPKTIEVAIARGGIGLLLLFSYPLFSHVARDSLQEMIAELSCKPYLLKSRLLYFVCVGIILGSTVSLALVNAPLDVLVNIVGSLAASNISYTLPGLFYFVLLKHQGWTLSRISSVFMIALGLIIMVANIVLWISEG